MRSSAFKLMPWTRLHPPLPRTSRESQQLLNALTSSFRRELDREHPPTASFADERSRTSHDSVRERPNNEHPQSSSHAADKHFSAILDSPLFRLSPQEISVRSHDTLGHKNARLQKDPMVYFDELVALGAATSVNLADCVVWQMLLASRHSGERYLKELRDSRAGSRAASWWLSSSEKNRFKLLTGRRVPVLCKFMVAEGLHDTVFAWLKFLATLLPQKGTLMHGDDPTTSFRLLLSGLLKAEIECGGGSASSMRLYLDACRIFMPTRPGQRQWAMKSSLGQSGGILLSMIVMGARESDKIPIPALLYEQYAAMMSTLPRSKRIGAMLALYHPTHPDATPFVRFLRDTSPKLDENLPREQHERLMRVGHDALRVLVDAGKPKDSDAFFVARLLQELGGGQPRDGKAPNSYGPSVSSEEKAMLSTFSDLGFA